MKYERARRRIVQSAGALMLLCGIFAACGSPELSFIPAADAGEDGLAPPPPIDSASTDADGGDGMVTDAPPPFDAPDEDADALSRQDAEKVPDGSACPGTDPCDCDNDGYRAKRGACNGDDCDDRDPLRHPNQGYVVERPGKDENGDWNCSGKEEKQYQAINCAALLGLNCNPTAQGFAIDAACGTEADYYACQPGLLSCRAVKIDKRWQGCK